MAQQDLTPQLRTRLSRVERAVGLFVTFATLVLLAGFVYYIYHRAKSKGWFLTKIVYQTGVNNAAGLAIGNPVKLMGFNVGEVTEIIPNEPYDYYGVTLKFRIQDPNFGYIWTDSKVRVAAADFLGNRYLEILKGREGIPTVLTINKKAVGLLDRKGVERKFKEEFSVLLKKIQEENPDFNEHSARAEATNAVQSFLNGQAKTRSELYYVALSNTNEAYWLDPLESPALTDRLETVVNMVEAALPNVLGLTNKLTSLLGGANTTVAEVNAILKDVRPVVTNLSFITSNLREPKGSLGEWILPKNINSQLESTLASADSTMRTADATLKTARTTLHNTDTNITLLVSNLNNSLENLANLTSNLNAQVQVNTNIISALSETIVHSDDLIQGLKRHWLLRSAFKTNKVQKGESPYPSRTEPLAIPRLKK
ncbi:MAG: Mammalian cell entry related domain protein [Verrucomicrobiales bacterium]|nr:Mammalian cell entry related domain protein [Verrucomicrobiales bacterium]